LVLGEEVPVAVGVFDHQPFGAGEDDGAVVAVIGDEHGEAGLAGRDLGRDDDGLAAAAEAGNQDE
jgi:hypothetical protein